MRRLLLLVALSAGCSAADDVVEPVALLEPEALLPVAADADPLAEHRPEFVNCPPPAWGPEGGGFEIETGICEYAAFAQPLPVTLEAGDELNVAVWHDFLDAAEPGTAHLAVWLGADVVWEAEVDIPAPSAALEATVILEKTPTPDARLGLHLHNHGYNTWRFVAIDAVDR